MKEVTLACGAEWHKYDKRGWHLAEANGALREIAVRELLVHFGLQEWLGDPGSSEEQARVTQLTALSRMGVPLPIEHFQRAHDQGSLSSAPPVSQVGNKAAPAVWRRSPMHILLKRIQAKFFLADFLESVVQRKYSAASHYLRITLDDMLWDALSDCTNDVADVLGHEKIVRLRETYYRVAGYLDMLRNDAVRSYSHYAADEIGVHPADLRVDVKLFLEQKALKRFPPLPPIEHFREAYPQKGEDWWHDVLEKFHCVTPWVDPHLP